MVEHNSQDELQYCGFKIDNEEFAIPVMDIQEVIKPQPITAIPLANEQIKGLLNLRGQIVTCITMRNLIGKEVEDESQYMNIIVKGEQGLYSLIVDEVTDIININKENIEKAPDTLSPFLRKYVTRVYKREEGLVVLLDVKKIIEFDKENED